MTASEAARWGLVNHTVPADDLLHSALALARQICRSAPLAVSAIKELTRTTEGLRLEDAFAAMRGPGMPAYRAVLASQDAKEGPAAFAEKRRPVWTGS